MACTHQIHEARLEMGLKTSGADALEPKKAKCHGVSSASQPRGPKVEGHVVRDERRLLTRHELHEAADGTFSQRRLLGQQKNKNISSNSINKHHIYKGIEYEHHIYIHI